MSEALRFDQFMADAVRTYYANVQPFGKDGDFITSPEISQLFGETIAAWCAYRWQEMGCPKFSLTELGPGRGTLMSDILRILSNIPEIYDSLDSVILVENSEQLTEIQKETLSEHKNIKWLASVDEIKADNLICVANEFFDALPVRQFIIENQKLYEVYVLDGKLIRQFISDTEKEDSVFEVCDSALHISEKLIGSCTKFSGLFIDYGYFDAPGKPTVQALSKHKKVDILSNVGKCDITALVDFKALATEFAKNGATVHISTQAEFLKAYQIEARAHKLSLDSELDRLTSQTEMGELFKALEVYI